MAYFELEYSRGKGRAMKRALMEAFPNGVVDTFVEHDYGIWSLTHEKCTISMRRSVGYFTGGREFFNQTWEEDNSDSENDEVIEVFREEIPIREAGEENDNDE